ncbi:MAG: hypothetical protein JWQ95_1915 [Sphaerisporangium sp.]|nr:hypothetical protein [Sphaerisporangium sp.]
MMLVLHVASGEKDTRVTQEHVAPLGTEYLFVPLGKIRSSLERREEREFPLTRLMLFQATTDQLKSRPQFRLRQLIH